MADNLKGIPFSSKDEGTSFPDRARRHVATTADIEFKETYVVMFTYILGNYKALVSTTEPDGKYYEVTHNDISGETYIDTYVKTRNLAVFEGD